MNLPYLHELDFLSIWIENDDYNDFNNKNKMRWILDAIEYYKSL